MARPFKPYQASWGTIYPGLYRSSDGRWRIVAINKWFRESDERRAVQRFLDWQTKNSPPETVAVYAQVVDPASITSINVSVTSEGEHVSLSQAKAEVRQAQLAAHMLKGNPDIKVYSRETGVSYKVPAPVLWAWLREQLITRPGDIANAVGIPELASLARLPLPKPSPKISAIIDAYLTQCPASDKAKQEAISAFKKLIKHTGAMTLEHLSTAALMAFRAAIEADIPATSTRRAYYSRIRNVLRFGLKVGLDADQIGAALIRCQVLWSQGKNPPADPKPISVADWRKLLSTAGNGKWRAWLLLGLNCALYIQDICCLRWSELDLEKGYYTARRGKTGVARASVLWPETILALKSLPRQSDFVFISNRGTRYVRNSRVNLFAKLRDRAALPHVVFSSLRDAAYTTAIEGAPDERQARVLAGHVAPGLLDRYVLRNPAFVAPACSAIYQRYMISQDVK